MLKEQFLLRKVKKLFLNFKTGKKKGHLLSDLFYNSYCILNSILLFIALPSAVVLSAIGLLSP